MKHTPGPWRVSDDELGFGPYDILADNRGWPNLGIATVVSGRFADHKLGTVGLPAEECRANAEFIVRACNAHDDLLEVLLALYELRGQINYDSAIWKDAIAAIQKARGE